MFLFGMILFILAVAGISVFIGWVHHKKRKGGPTQGQQRHMNQDIIDPH